MKETGLRISSMGRGKRHGVTRVTMKVSMPMANDTEKAFSIGPMESSSLERS